MPKLSVLIITLNEEKNICRCLESVKWADEIIVIDSYSQDQTVKIAREFTDKIYIEKWQGFAATKNFGLEKTSNEWILWIDADEEVPPELAKEIQESIKSGDFDGYQIPRKANFLGRWIIHSGWYPGYVLRLIKQDFAHFPEKSVHEYLEPPSKTGKLNTPILHYTDPNVNHYFNKLNRYTSLAAEELISRDKKFHFSDLLFRPLHITLKMYILKLGFLDGFQGFLLAVFSGYYVFIKYAKLWELQKHNG